MLTDTHTERDPPNDFCGSTHAIRTDSVNSQSLSASSYKQKRSTAVRSKVPASQSSPAIFSPAVIPVFLVSGSEKPLAIRRTSSASFSIQQNQQSSSNQLRAFPSPQWSWNMKSDSDDGDDDSMMQTSWLRRKQSTATKKGFKDRLFRFATGSHSRSREKLISTRPGERGAGETETERDEPPRHLPTSRKVPLSAPLIPPNVLQQRLTPLLFEFSRLLSIVPSLVGILFHVYHIYRPPDSNVFIDGRRPPERIDFVISALWAILTGYQCLCLTTGLLARWRVYYPPHATLIRLVSLQAICWPATHFTLSLLEHEKRPVMVWAVIGTTTCASRSVQIWVTSNLWWEVPGANGAGAGAGAGAAAAGMTVPNGSDTSVNWQKLKGGRWGGRRWDWSDVVKKCVLPAGLVYFIMAWGEQLRREWSGC